MLLARLCAAGGVPGAPSDVDAADPKPHPDAAGRVARAGSQRVSDRVLAQSYEALATELESIASGHGGRLRAAGLADLAVRLEELASATRGLVGEFDV
jgi:hypothetical protein